MRALLRNLVVGLGWIFGTVVGVTLLRSLIQRLRESSFLRNFGVWVLNSLFGKRTTKAPPPQEKKESTRRNVTGEESEENRGEDNVISAY